MGDNHEALERASAILDLVKYSNGASEYVLSEATKLLLEELAEAVVKSDIEGGRVRLSEQVDVFDDSGKQVCVGRLRSGETGIAFPGADFEPVSGLRFNATHRIWEGEMADPEVVPVPGERTPREPAVVVIAREVVRMLRAANESEEKP